MNETEKIDVCERAGELVAYFYGEATRAERESFDTHLTRCGACRDELTAFAGVRETVGHWRAEIAGNAPALSYAEMFAPEARGAAVNAEAHSEARREASRMAVAQRRSALAALREFFTLSPLWLRAGVFAAALVLCALAGLAVANAEVRWDDNGLAFSTRLRRDGIQNAPPAQVSAPDGKVYTQAELDKLVAERDAAWRELEDTRAQLDDSREANLIAAAATLEPASASSPVSTRSSSRRDGRVRSAPGARPKRQRGERDEEDVPRLYDLLIEAN
jgi:hypothetical protein